MTVRQCAATFRPGLDQVFPYLEPGRDFLAAQQLFRLLENLMHRQLFHGWQFTVRARSGHHNSFRIEARISLDSPGASLAQRRGGFEFGTAAEELRRVLEAGVGLEPA